MSGADKQPSNTLRAVDDLRALIFSGRLAAGTDHLETELADMLGMSRTPVREATRIVEAQGLLEIRPRKGVRILALSARDMDEIYVVLTELESLAAALAAEAGHGPEDLRPLRASIEDMETSLAVEDREAWAEADERFHQELVRLSGNSRIMEIVSKYNDQVRRARAMTLHIRPLPVRSNADHRAVYDALMRGDAAEARRIHWQHRTNARHVLTDILKKFGLQRL